MAPQKVVRTTLGHRLTLVGFDGLVSATVYSVAYDVKATEAVDPPDAGTEYIEAKVRICAGSHGFKVTPTIFSPIAFTVDLAGGTDDSMMTDSPTAPSVFDAVNVMRPDQCVDAYAAFEEPRGSRVTAVGEGDADAPDYIWRVPRST